MKIRKRPRASATAEVVPPRHRYPTRWKLRQEKANVTVHIPCKRNKVVKCILHLPRDIIFNILLLVPALFLHQVVRYVCKQWNDIVNDPRFIKAHCQLSSAGLLVQSPFDPPLVYYIEGDDLKEFAFPLPGRIYGSFNGLVLFHEKNNPQILSVINPLTKAKINLPPVQGLKEYFPIIGFAITSSGHYKVVVTLRDEGQCSKIQVMVFTVGIDKAWRFIDLQGNSEMKCMSYSRPSYIAGMLYWCDYYYPCFAMDVDTETIYHLPKPVDFVPNFNQSFFISLGAGLGLIVNKTDEMRLWKLTDVKSGEWTEVAGINISAAYSTVRKKLSPKDTYSFPFMLIDDMFWFNHVVGEHDLFLIRFNLVDQSFVLFPIKHKYGLKIFYHHVHTLLSPYKCYS
ncbi:putative F-box protein At3g17490 isoform X2 [Silene latifolia]|uniref:putative F-box protein At3g17490 isoform X2 n=1 Tax=Silene latifolia TaxID=37657 RepID=UPI003D76B715